ncbi:hypothetical protein [Burkholderia dolosa]|uniref:hypothetical protein n=1 Tax=Burkholderia dolosa TaxID=152500 RepID=UPI001B92F715|nr:hypothetical protein [Burkholderia dolosa]MBR8056457.1 hypothetical protein [Burkholderia dolosa]
MDIELRQVHAELRGLSPYQLLDVLRVHVRIVVEVGVSRQFKLTNKRLVRISGDELS